MKRQLYCSHGYKGSRVCGLVWTTDFTSETRFISSEEDQSFSIEKNVKAALQFGLLHSARYTFCDPLSI